ncbi:MAG: hypothetical protein ABW221_15560 [Vicinamibacteria bacterium]
MNLERWLAVLALGAALASGARADEWDVAATDDDDNGTSNALFHGSEQVHDMVPRENDLPDEDWYFVSSRPWSSYQVVVDGMTGDLDLAASSLQLVNAPNLPVADARVEDFGGILSLVWSNLHPPSAQPNLFRVRNAACGLGCTNADRYRIRLFDTTYTIARFNNSGTQSTVLVVQNATAVDCEVAYVLLDAAGALLGSTERTIPPFGVDVLAAASLAPNLSGSVRIPHTCGLGGISGKAVSIEPATGFTFDTAMVPRPH